MVLVFKTRQESRAFEVYIKQHGNKKYYKQMQIDILNGLHKESNIIYFKNITIPE